VAKKSFSIYDFLVIGIKSVLENIRLFMLIFLSYIGITIATVLTMGLVARPIIIVLWRMIPKFKSQFSTCATKEACHGVMKSFWGQVYPILISNTLLLVFCGLLAIVVFAGLYLGFIQIMLDLHKNGSSKVSRLFSCFHLVPKFLISAFIFFSAVSLGLALFIVPGIYLFLRFRFFPYYVIDKDAGIIECIKKSYRATRGFEWDVLGLNIVAGVIWSITFFIGVPAASMMMVSAYKKLPTKV